MDDAVEILFSGHDRGIDQGVEYDYERKGVRFALAPMGVEIV
jgi:hypothetical protein